MSPDVSSRLRSFPASISAMTLPDKALFTIQEAMSHLALSRPSVYRLISEGQLTRVHPRPRSARITRESLSAHLERAAQPGAVAISSKAGQQAQVQERARVQAEGKAKKRGGLLSRWGIGGR